jgi:hypothetical protein
LGNLPKCNVVLEIRKQCIEKYSHIFKSVYKGLKLSDPGLGDGEGTMHAREKRNASTVLSKETSRKKHLEEHGTDRTLLLLLLVIRAWSQGSGLHCSH